MTVELPSSELSVTRHHWLMRVFAKHGSSLSRASEVRDSPAALSCSPHIPLLFSSTPKLTINSLLRHVQTVGIDNHPCTSFGIGRASRLVSQWSSQALEQPCDHERDRGPTTVPQQHPTGTLGGSHCAAGRIIRKRNASNKNS